MENIKGALSADFFAFDGTTGRPINDVQMQQFKSDGLLIFEKNILAGILTNIDSWENILKPGGGVNTPDCNCSRESDWCDVWGNIGRPSCKLKKCSAGLGGCGTFWSYTCGGICSIG